MLYLELCVPSGTEPGRYNGQLAVRFGDATSAALPLEVDVAPVEIPATSTLQNTFGLGVYVLAHPFGVKRESPEATALLQPPAGRCSSTG